MSGKVLNLQSPWLWASIATILFNPIFWNIVARNEYRNKSLTKIFGSPYNGTYVLAVAIFSLGIFRDWVYHHALVNQPTSALLDNFLGKAVGAVLFAVGQTLVITSIYALGVTGTYLGDYFGILMKHRVTSFPFNVMTDPMYQGSTMCFIGTALWYGRPAGLVISGLVWVVYQIALNFEGPFTDKIYSSAAANKKRGESVKTNVSKAVSEKAEAVSSAVSNAADKAKSAASSQSTQTQRQTRQQTQTSSTSSTSTTQQQQHHAAGSYAAAAAEIPGPNALSNTEPKKQGLDLSHLGLGNAITTPAADGNIYPGVGKQKVSVMNPGVDSRPTGTPSKITRSASRARIVDDD